VCVVAGQVGGAEAGGDELGVSSRRMITLGLG
jgi:hypothetical protein